MAAEIGADLVALASHSRRGLGRVLLGSVAEHVARFAPCAVLILPAVSVAQAAPRRASLPELTNVDTNLEDQVDALAVRVCELVESRTGFLSALLIGLPDHSDAGDWEDALVRRLGAAGIQFVDLAFTRTDSGSAEILAARFEELPEDP